MATKLSIIALFTAIHLFFCFCAMLLSHSFYHIINVHINDIVLKNIAFIPVNLLIMYIYSTRPLTDDLSHLPLEVRLICLFFSYLIALPCTIDIELSL